mgnify:CR=1 FL=1
MKNIEVIETFINGGNKAKTANLYIDGENLVNYSTVIAHRINNRIYLNSTKYSQTTSRIQNMIRNNTPSRLLIEVNSNEILNIKEEQTIAA